MRNFMRDFFEFFWGLLKYIFFNVFLLIMLILLSSLFAACLFLAIYLFSSIN